MPILVLTLIILGFLAFLALRKLKSGGSSEDAHKLRELNLPDFPANLTLEGEALPAIAIVQGFPTLSTDSIVASLKKHWPEIGPFSVSTEPDETRVIQANKIRFKFSLVGRASTSASYVSALRQSAIWPQAEERVGAHDATLVVTVEGVPPGLGYVGILTCAVGALLESCPQIEAIWWPMANHVIPRAQALKGFINQVKEQPIALWVSTNIYANDDGGVNGYTHGLRSLGVDEFEAIRSPEAPNELRDRLASLAVYSVFTCKTIFNGDTTGVDEFERITLKKEPSQTVHKGWVFHLHY